MCFESSDFLWVDLKFCWLRSSITVSPRPADLYHQVLLSRLRCQIHTLFWAHRTLILDTILLCLHLAPKSFYVHTSNTQIVLDVPQRLLLKLKLSAWSKGLRTPAAFIGTNDRLYQIIENEMAVNMLKLQSAFWENQEDKDLQNRTGEPCRTGTGVCKPIPSISDSSLRVIRRWW